MAGGITEVIDVVEKNSRVYSVLVIDSLEIKLLPLRVDGVLLVKAHEVKGLELNLNLAVRLGDTEVTPDCSAIIF